MSDRVTELAMDSLVDTHNELMRTSAELSRLTALVEGLTPEKVHSLIWPHAITPWKRLYKADRQHYVDIADRIRAYLKEQK